MNSKYVWMIFGFILLVCIIVFIQPSCSDGYKRICVYDKCHCVSTQEYDLINSCKTFRNLFIMRSLMGNKPPTFKKTLLSW